MEEASSSPLSSAGFLALPRVELFIGGGEHFLHVLGRVAAAGNADDAAADAAAREAVPIAKRTQLDLVEVFQRRLHPHDFLLVEFGLNRKARPEVAQEFVQRDVEVAQFLGRRGGRGGEGREMRIEPNDGELTLRLPRPFSLSLSLFEIPRYPTLNHYIDQITIIHAHTIEPLI